MSVYIHGMEMPESCHVCVGGFGGCCYVAPADTDGICPDEGRADFCPLIPVPPHGRLIDADALQVDMMEIVASGMYGEEDCIDAVIEAPTIIPADPASKEEEG